MKKELKEMLTAEYCQVWSKSPKMIDYCVNKATQAAILPDGEIITINKQAIEKHFCFGESGFDYDDAAAMANYASRSENYFISENMKYFDTWVKDLETALDDLINGNLGDSALIIYPRKYSGQPDGCRLASIDFIRWYEVIDALGGTARVDEMPGAKIKYRTQDAKIATVEDLQIILEAYKAARTDHEKRVKTYLKKYGLSNVRTWTYWRDA